jgi:N-acetylglucosaminyl-diphospho-decaprenol L-rhamnosyltransferase
LATPKAPQVVVADNGLESRIAHELRAAGAEVHSMGRNAGFAAAVNHAARRADGDVLIVLNDDVRPSSASAFLGGLVEALRTSEMAAAVLVDDANRDVIASAGIELDGTLNAHDYLRGQPLESLTSSPPPPVGPCGAAAAYDRAAFLNVGGYDEGFFAYWEDVDLALRFRVAGGRCGLAARSRATHAVSSTLGSGSLQKATVVGFSRGYFLRKYGVLGSPRRAARVLGVEVVGGAALVVRHRSLRPAAARVRGWRACDVRALWPEETRPTVGVLDGVSRRISRAANA